MNISGHFAELEELRQRAEAAERETAQERRWKEQNMTALLASEATRRELMTKLAQVREQALNNGKLWADEVLAILEDELSIELDITLTRTGPERYFIDEKQVTKEEFEIAYKEYMETPLKGDPTTKIHYP